MSSSIDQLRAHMKAAYAYSQLSKARRLKVGAVLVKDGRIISVGFNGTPSKMDNKCEVVLDDGTMVTKSEVVHAETNVIAFAAKNGVSTDGCIMVITSSPCYECSKLIIQSGVKEVWYENEYRDTSSFDFLRKGKVKVSKF